MVLEISSLLSCSRVADAGYCRGREGGREARREEGRQGRREKVGRREKGRIGGREWEGKCEREGQRKRRREAKREGGMNVTSYSWLSKVSVPGFHTGGGGGLEFPPATIFSHRNLEIEYGYYSFVTGVKQQSCPRLRQKQSERV